MYLKECGVRAVRLEVTGYRLRIVISGNEDWSAWPALGFLLVKIRKRSSTVRWKIHEQQ